MLNQLLIKHRVNDLFEIGFDNNKEYKHHQNKAYRAYKRILKKFIPKERLREFDRLHFKYDLETERAMVIFAEEAYRQGILDGLELSKILK